MSNLQLPAPAEPILTPPRPPQIIRKVPPNYGKIVSVFPAASSLLTIFTYGNDIYYRGDVPLTKALMDHEGVHVLQQLNYPGGAAAWWDRYLVDTAFRFVQELNAHQVEYQSYCAMNVRTRLPMKTGTHVTERVFTRPMNRQERKLGLKAIATRLSGPLYNHIVSLDEAKRLILGKPVKVWKEAIEMAKEAA